MPPFFGGSDEHNAMHEAVEKLFQHTRAKITEQDIRDFSPNDPGYLDYVRLWTEIWKSGVIPRENEFDLSEVINLTGWFETKQLVGNDLKRFFSYRRFTGAVALGLIHHGNDSEDVRPANYLARDLIIDHDVTDPEHLNLLQKVFSVTREMLVSTGHEDEYPFFTFGMMILGQRAGDWDGAAQAAAMLIEDERIVWKQISEGYGIIDNRFLLRLTYYDARHADWIAFAKQLSNPKNDESTQLIIDALSNLSS
jgi:hypothetical protein